MSKKLLWVVMVVFALGLTATAFAQSSVQTGNLNGTVKDETGAVLPGVTVTITSPAMIVPQLVTQTDEHGFFRFPAIPPGVYQVKFELEGFATLVRKGIVVSLGKTTTLNVTMKVAAVAETITVTGESPVVDKQSTTISVNFTTDLLRHLPSTRSM
ncbi:MAG: carboxypeptidase regulatory-like domain-containing protein, partial [Acidobacteria bacterium]|nr:carboxypeptidase regulatory-like domain-containing protein [Acidobacteriota bacterium]